VLASERLPEYVGTTVTFHLESSDAVSTVDILPRLKTRVFSLCFIIEASAPRLDLGGEADHYI
jgi:hypothetical protein